LSQDSLLVLVHLAWLKWAEHKVLLYLLLEAEHSHKPVLLLVLVLD
jgi:hypothetical protein